MEAKVKKTGKIITVFDYGPKLIPRYWSKTTGYSKDELIFPKLVFPAEKKKLKRVM